MCWRIEYHLPSSRDAPSRARAAVLADLGRLIVRGAEARRIVEDAELVVSELVTNAVTARSRHVDVRITAHGDRVELSVHDDGDGRPEPRTAGLFDTTGRGLIIVSAVASQWGVEPGPDGSKWVWARLSVPRALTDRVPCLEPALARRT